MPEFHQRGGEFRVALQRHAHAKYRQRQLALLELAQDAPDATAGTVLVDALHADMALRIAGRIEHLGEELLRAGVAVQHAVLAAFLVVEHELHGDPGFARPVGPGRAAGVADQIARIGAPVDPRGHQPASNTARAASTPAAETIGAPTPRSTASNAARVVRTLGRVAL